MSKALIPVYVKFYCLVFKGYTVPICNAMWIKDILFASRHSIYIRQKQFALSVENAVRVIGVKIEAFKQIHYFSRRVDELSDGRVRI